MIGTIQSNQTHAHPSVPHEPKVSLIILTYNSERTLHACLQAINSLDYPKQLLEIILLDNGSTDSSISVARSFGLAPHILPDLNLSELRNYGAEKAGGDILAYIDSDCVVAPDWVRQAVKWFTNPAVGIAGNEYLLPENPSTFERHWYNKSNFGVKYDELIPAGNMAIDKSLFQQLGGFDDRLLTGEDDYIVGVFRQNGLLTVSDHLIHSIHLGNAKNLLQYFRKETWYGLGMLGTLGFSVVDKPLIATLVFFGMLLVSVATFIGFFFSGNQPLLAAAWTLLIAALAIPLAAALERTYRKNRRGNLLYVMIVFIVFFTARLRALCILGIRGISGKS